METSATNAINFLLFSYFSFSLKSLQEKDADTILHYLIARAYRDAASHVLSIENNNPRDLEEEGPDKKIIDAIQNLTKEKDIFQSWDQYTEWHKSLCSRLQDCYEKTAYKKDAAGKTRPFTLGIAQKWVNMTMKYMVIIKDLQQMWSNELDGTPFIKQYGSMIESVRPSLHVPVDSYILDAVWGLDHNIPMPCKNGKQITNKQKENDHFPDAIVAWSKWREYDGDYSKFQKTLYEKLSALHNTVIEWEADAWITQAEKRVKIKTPKPEE